MVPNPFAIFYVGSRLNYPLLTFLQKGIYPIKPFYKYIALFDNITTSSAYKRQIYVILFH